MNIYEVILSVLGAGITQNPLVNSAGGLPGLESLGLSSFALRWKEPYHKELSLTGNTEYRSRYCVSLLILTLMKN